MKTAFLLIIYFLLAVSASAQSVDILWQGNTYTPPFYQGKRMWSTQATITFVAIPHGLGSVSNLNFKWIKNGTILGNDSGVGRNSLSLTDSILSKEQIVAVEIVSDSASGEDVLTRKTVVVKPIKPAVSVYENSPLYGFMFHRAVGSEYQMRGREITFAAFPLFFSTNTRVNSNLSYEWKTNTGSIETRNSVTYRTPDEATGSSNVSLKVSDKTSITQNIKKNFLVKFGQ